MSPSSFSLAHCVRYGTTAVISAFLMAASAQLARADEATRCIIKASNQTFCRIDEPIVSKPQQPYPQVVFQPGDQIVVNAGGCVQTGGWGDTWKLYVDPRGPDSDVKYWGTISIPGGTPGFVRIRDVIGRTITLGPRIPEPATLSLGYVDSDYSDNGYSNPDNGTGDQCKNVGNAFVELTITHAPGTNASCAGSSGSSPLDLVWTTCDLNGFPMNPVWRSQATASGMPTGNVAPAPLTQCPQALVTVPGNQPSDPPVTYIDFPQSCVSWPINYDSGALCGPHVNYFAVTYQQPVDWWLKSDSYPSFSGWDDDYNYYMHPVNREGEVDDHPDTANVEIEWDSDETIDHFSDSSPLWAKFRNLVDNDNDAAQKMVQGKTAVVTSLLGFDCGHLSCGAEEHPAYAMAVDMDDSNLADDQWGVFARNWGDEGMCSDNDHNLPLTELKVLIPWRWGMSDVKVLFPDTQFHPFSNSDSGATAQSPFISVVQGQGVLLDFTLPDPSAQVGMAGEVHLQWTQSALSKRLPGGIVGRSFAGSSGNQTGRLAAGNIVRSGVLFHPSDESEKPEARVSALLSRMPAADLHALEARIPAAAVRATATPAKLAMPPVMRLASLPAPPRAARLVIPQTIPNPQLAQRHELLRSALCQQYNNKVPGFPSICRRMPIRRMERRP
jgi:hypothetical protein